MHVREGLTTLFRCWSNLNHGFCWLSYHRNWNHFLHLCIKLFFFFWRKKLSEIFVSDGCKFGIFCVPIKKKKSLEFFDWHLNGEYNMWK